MFAREVYQNASRFSWRDFPGPLRRQFEKVVNIGTAVLAQDRLNVVRIVPQLACSSPANTTHYTSSRLYSGRGDETRRDGTGRDETRRDGTRRDGTRRDETRRDETKRDETRRDETRRDETRRDGTRRDETRRDETRRDGIIRRVQLCTISN